MPQELRYGIDSEIRIPDAATARLGFRSDGILPEGIGPVGSGPDGIAAAARAALAVPLDYPTPAQAVVAGDQVVLLLEPGVPHGAEIAAVIAEQLIEHGFDGDDITVLQADAAIAADVLPIHAAVHAGGRSTPGKQGGSGQVRVATHDPHHRNGLAYLTNTASGRPIYLNRILLDADVIIPIGCYRGDLSWSYRGVCGGVYPTFSDDATRARYRNPHMLDSRDEVFGKSQREIDTVGRLAGMQFTVQVLPGSGDDVAGVTAGETSAVARRAEAWWNGAWRNPRPEPAEVVVAGLHGRHSRNWTALARVLETATTAVEEGGSILVCSDLDQAPGPAFEMLVNAEDREAAIRKIRRDRPLDAPAALILAAAQEKARVYLLSSLDSSVVDEWGMTPIDDGADVGRFVGRHSSCTIIADAQHVSFASHSR